MSKNITTTTPDFQPFQFYMK